MPVCLIAQPIHRAGVERLQASGIEVCHATSSDDSTMAREMAHVDALIVRDGLSAHVIDASPKLDEAALAPALHERRIFGAGLDVFANEPLPKDSPLTELDNVVLTPHMAGSTEEALQATAMQCADQVIDVLAGRRPAYLVQPSMWPQRRRARV